MKNSLFWLFLCFYLSAAFAVEGCQFMVSASGSGVLRPEPTVTDYHLPGGVIGTARYYAPRFNGRKTASGEIYNSKKLTAAHPTLPLGTFVRVTNLSNNKSVTVRINDRCRKQEEGFIDASREASRQLDFIKRGKAVVRMIIVPQDPLSDKAAYSQE